LSTSVAEQPPLRILALIARIALASFLSLLGTYGVCSAIYLAIQAIFPSLGELGELAVIAVLLSIVSGPLVAEGPLRTYPLIIRFGAATLVGILLGLGMSLAWIAGFIVEYALVYAGFAG